MEHAENIALLPLRAPTTEKTALLLLHGADHMENISTILLTARVLDRVYRAVALQPVDQIG
jgi:hypothetical protein